MTGVVQICSEHLMFRVQLIKVPVTGTAMCYVPVFSYGKHCYKSEDSSYHDDDCMHKARIVQPRSLVFCES